MTTVPTGSTSAAGDVRFAVAAPPLLAAFNAAGVVAATDVHVATRLGRLTGEDDATVLLAVALVVRALRGGSVCVRLDDADELAALARPEDTDPAGDRGEPPADPPPWPEHADWVRAIEASPLVAAGVDGPVDRPARWVGGRLYLDRYWRDELTVRRLVDARLVAAPLDADRARLDAALARLFPAATDVRQRLAAEHAAGRRLTVLTGGPGTGKTTTVARLLAVLQDAAGGEGRALRVALAAPTGKAAARLQEAVRDVVADLDPDDRARTGRPEATTVHRLLGYRSATRFRHHAGHHLPHDVVVVDETSMVPLSLMARLLESLRPDARLVLVGDPDQLASVEAGAVLGDLVARPPVVEPVETTPVVEPVETTPVVEPVETTPVVEPVETPVSTTGVVNGVVRLVTVHRQGSDSAILPLAAAIRDGDADTVLDVLRAGTGGVELVEADTEHLDEHAVAGLRDDAIDSGRRLVAAARAGDAGGALEALSAHRVMVAHRRGPVGVARWAAQVEAWVEEATADAAAPAQAATPWVVGRPLLVTSNDAEVGLYNGDTGVLVAEGDPSTSSGRRPSPQASDGSVVAVFGDPRTPLRVRTHRLPPVETVHAMTVHRAQGSQFRRVSLILPPETSPLLTRELLYTAVTRAQELVRVVASADAVRAAVGHPVRRASGLRDPLPE